MNFQGKYQVTGALLIGLISVVPAGAWDLDGLPINEPGGYHEGIQLVADGNDGFYIIWQYVPEVGDPDILAQRRDKRGEPVWDPPTLSVCSASGNQLYPRAVKNGAGGFYVVWEDHRSGSHVYIQSVYPDGTTEFPQDGALVCTNQPYQYNPRIVYDGHLGVVVVWEDVRSFNKDIFAQRITYFDGLAWTETGVAVCAAADDQSNSDLTVLYDPDPAQTRITVAWVDERNADYDIYAQRLTLVDGVRQWGDDGKPIETGPESQLSPRVVAGLSGSTIFAWYEFLGGLYDDRIYVDHFDRYGDSYGWSFFWEGPAFRIAPDGYGGVYLGHTSVNPNPLTTYGMLQKINGGTHEFTKYLYTSSDYSSWDIGVRILSAANQGSFACYFIEFSDLLRLRAQRFSISGNTIWDPSGGVPVCSVSAEHKYPEVLELDWPKNILVAWIDGRNASPGVNDIYAQRLSWKDGAWGYMPAHILSVTDQAGDLGGLVSLHIEASDKDNFDNNEAITGYNVWRRLDSPAPPEGQEDENQLVQMMSDPVMGEGLKMGTEQAARLGFPDGSWISLGFHAAVQQSEYYLLAATGSDSSEAGISWETFVVTAHTARPLEYYISDPDSGYSVDNSDPGGQSGVAEEIRPRSATLAQNHPNPFNPNTIIAFEVARDCRADLRIFDVTGRLIRRLLSGESVAAGHHEKSWNGRDDQGRLMPSGTYYYSLDASGIRETKRMVLLK